MNVHDWLTNLSLWKLRANFMFEMLFWLFGSKNSACMANHYMDSVFCCGTTSIGDSNSYNLITIILILIGGKKYEIKGCPVKGGFAQVYKAYVNSNPDEVVALKVIKPPPLVRVADSMSYWAIIFERNCRYKGLLFLGSSICTVNLINGSQTIKYVFFLFSWFQHLYFLFFNNWFLFFLL